MRVLLACLALASCGSAIVPEEFPPEVAGKPFEGGQYEAQDGQKYDIPLDKPLLLTFSGSFCSACNAEAKHYVQFLKGKDPQKVKLLTISISDDQEEVQAWKQELKAPWEFGVAEKAMYRKYCPNLVPCNLLIKDGKIVKQQVGEISPQDAARYLGPIE